MEGMAGAEALQALPGCAHTQNGICAVTLGEPERARVPQLLGAQNRQSPTRCCQPQRRERASQPRPSPQPEQAWLGAAAQGTRSERQAYSVQPVGRT